MCSVGVVRNSFRLIPDRDILVSGYHYMFPQVRPTADPHFMT